MLKTIIMAAGEGTRMKSSTSKVLHKLLNREIIRYVVDASKFDNSETIVIGGKNKVDLENLLNDVTIIEQKIGDEYPYGTGYAASLALDNIEDDDQVLVLNGDIPLITKASLEEFVDNHISYDNSASVLSTKVVNPIGYGRIIRDENSDFIGIVEHKDLEINQLVTRTVLSTQPITVEYQLTDYGRTLKKIIEHLAEWGVEHRKKIIGKVLEN